jgi:hypothetical protein
VTAAQVNAQLSAMAAAGLRDARVDAVWAYTEAQRGVFDWSFEAPMSSPSLRKGGARPSDRGQGCRCAARWARARSGHSLTARSRARLCSEEGLGGV